MLLIICIGVCIAILLMRVSHCSALFRPTLISKIAMHGLRHIASLLVGLRPRIAILLLRVGRCSALFIIVGSATAQHQQNSNAMPDLLKIIWHDSRPC